MRRRILMILVGLALVASGLTATPPASSAAQVASLGDVIPEPVSVSPDTGHTHVFTSGLAIHVQSGSSGAMDAAKYLAGLLGRSTGFALPIDQVTSAGSNGISLMLTGAPD